MKVLPTELLETNDRSSTQPRALLTAPSLPPSEVGLASVANDTIKTCRSPLE